MTDLDLEAPTTSASSGSRWWPWAAGNDRSDISSGHPHDGTPVDLTPWWVGGPPPVNSFSDLVGTHGVAFGPAPPTSITGEIAPSCVQRMKTSAVRFPAE